MPVAIKCAQCGEQFSVIPARAGIAKFCSRKCKSLWMSTQVGEAHPRWTGGERKKNCAHCGAEFSIRPGQPITTFKTQKFCSKPCADAGGFRYTGESHPQYKPDARRKNRGQHHSRWADKVVSRDNQTCQHCGATGVELHAHHIKPWKDYPELRDDVSNGVTLCAPCHWAVHTVSDAKGVNSGKLPPGNAEDNPEPSHGRNTVEGVTTNGRAFRRSVGECVVCKKQFSRRLSDLKGRAFIACSYECAAIHRWAIRKGSNSDTSALPVKG